MSENITPLDIAQRLAEGVRCGTCGGDGYVQSEGLPDIQATCPTCTGTGVERHPQEVNYKYYEFVYDEDGNLKLRADAYGPLAMHPADAILWLLSTRAWRAKFGDCELRLQGTSAAIWKPVFGSLMPMSIKGDAPADLLRAMLEALT